MSVLAGEGEKPEPSRVERVASKLRNKARDGGKIGRGLVASEAAKLHISPETLYRRIRRVPLKGQPTRFSFDEAGINACYVFRGDMVKLEAWLTPRRIKAGQPPVSLSTLYRALRDLPAWERAAIKYGQKEWRQKILRILKPDGVTRPNQVWHLDHAQLGIWLMLPRKGRKPRKIWITTIKDGCTKKILGWSYCLDGRPSRQNVKEALWTAISRYGVPLIIRWDNALEWLANETTEIVLDLDIIPAPIDSYTPSQNGTIERYHRSIDQLLLKTLPGWDRAPRDDKGHLTGQVLKQNAFIELFESWVTWFNDVRVHASLGCTPTAAWEAAKPELRFIPQEELRWMLEHEEDRVVGPYGIEVEGRYYVDEALKLKDHIGQKFRVRFVIHDPSLIEVYHGSKHFCTALPNEGRSDEFNENLLKSRAKDAQTVARRRRAADKSQTRIAGEYWESLTGAEQLTDTPVDDQNARAVTAIEEQARADELPTHDLLDIPTLAEDRIEGV